MKPLGALDALFLHLETAATPMHVGALHLLQRAPDASGELIDAIRDHLARRMHLSPVFTRQLAPMPLAIANPVWRSADAVDLEQHVRRVTLPAPGSQSQLEALVAGLHAQLLPRDRPLWQFTLIDGLEGGQQALYTKIHHATLDGAAAVALAQALLDVTPTPRDVAPAIARAKRVMPTRFQMLGAALRTSSAQTARLARALPDLARSAAGLLQAVAGGRVALSALARQLALAPPTPMNRAIDGGRTIATASIPLAAVTGIAKLLDAKLNDVVLAIVSGALRRYLGPRGGVPEQPLVVAMPVSLRASGDTEANTQATMTLARLATNVADPLERLRAIQQSASAAKDLVKGLQSGISLDLPSIGLPWLLTAAATLYGKARVADRIPPLANLVVSNVPGPPVPLYLAGARLLTFWPLSIVEHGLGLNITLQSYAGSLDFGLVAARRLLPDLAPLAAALHAAYEELAAAALGAAARPLRTTGAKRPGAVARAAAPAALSRTPARAAKPQTRAQRPGAPVPRKRRTRAAG